MKTPRFSSFAAWPARACSIAVLAIAVPADAADTVYTFAGTSGNWNAAGTWTGGNIPPEPSAGNVVLATVTSTPITLNVAATIGAIKATGSTAIGLGIANSTAIAFTMDGTGMSAANNGFGNAATASILNGTAGGGLNVRPSLILKNTDLDIGFVGASGSATMAIGVATVNSSSITNADNVDRALNFRINASGGIITVASTIGAQGSLGGAAPGTGLINISNLGTVGTGAVSITGNLTAGVGSVIQNSASSRMALSGANSYDGIYTITSGALSFINRTALFNADTAKWTAAKIAVTANGTLGLGYGSAGNFSADEIEQINNGTILTAGSRLGIDNSVAATYSKIIANANGGATVTGFNKLGAGALTLDGVNTYEGITNITVGTLILGSAQGATTGALGNTSAIVFNGGTLQFSAANTFDYSSKFNSAGNAILVNTGGQNVTFASGLTTGTTGTLGKAGTGTLTLTGISTFGLGTNVGVNVTGGTLRGLDSTVRTGNAALNKVFGVGAVQLAGGTTLELRANGTDDASAQNLTFGNQLQVSTTAASYTVNVDRDAATGGTGKTLVLGNHNVGANTILNVTGSNGFNLGIGQLQIGGGAAASVMTLNPTTANLIVGSVGGGSNTLSPTLKLDGTSAGNIVTGVLANRDTVATNRTSVLKSNTSTWTLNGTNTYTGKTTVEGGTLVVNGSIAASTAASPETVIQALGTLAGVGTINNALSIAGTIAVGAPAGGIGNMTFNSSVVGAVADFSGGGTMLWGIGSLTDLAGAAGTSYDQLDLTGTLGLTLGGTSKLTLAFESGVADPNSSDTFWTSAHSWKIINSTGSGTNATSSNFSQITNGTYTSGSFNTISDDLGNVTLNFTPVPEPGSAALLIAALGLSLRRRRAV